MSRNGSYAIAFSSLVLGMGSLIMFTVFLFVGSFSLVNLGLEPGRALALDAGLSLLFFVQHSVMIRRGIRERLSSFVPDTYYSAFYSIVSSVALISLIVFWQKTSVIASAEGASRLAIRALFFLSIAGFTWGTSALSSFDPYGIKKIKRHVRGKEERDMPLTIRGAYLWVRHPLYFFCLLMIWACPDLTWDRLLFNVMWSAWIVVGTMLEERDLVSEFGDRYREYRAKVPMIIPYKLPQEM